ncbi:MAG: DUF853 family protein [Actinobacteria bacterium]|nr:DUF853 family protein [Actinomycetota bacterium]
MRFLVVVVRRTGATLHRYAPLSSHGRAFDDRSIAVAEAQTEIAAGYTFDVPTITLGRPYVDPAAPMNDITVQIPVRLLNRHGLIAGATGTGKTKSLQLLAEQISRAGSPVFAADMKGDLAGIGAIGVANDAITARAKDLGYDWKPEASTVELVSLSGDKGVPIRASVSGFGPTLLAKVLALNETQESSLALVFRFCDENSLPLIELDDLSAALSWLTGPGKDQLATIGGLSKATVGVLLRKIGELEANGGDVFFGEPSFDVRDLLRTTPDGRGVLSVLQLSDVATQPQLFSTFLVWVLAELFEVLPEVGDPDKPVLVFFLDEAHLLFNGATKAFRDAVSQTVRLIRSKGVGVFFITQLPTDLPDEVLAQLGHRVQHAVRAFTPKDAKALKSAVETYPKTEYYDLAETLQSLGVGEALVTALNPRGVPTPVVATRMFPPASRMAPLADDEAKAIIAASTLAPRYATRVDKESAEEILAARIVGDTAAEEAARETARPAEPRSGAKAPQDEGLVHKVGEIVNSRIARDVGRQVVRGVFGMLRRR